MSNEDTTRILTINSGSSSVKFDLYEMGRTEEPVLAGRIERIGEHQSPFEIRGAGGETLLDEHVDLPDHDAAFRALFSRLGDHTPDLHAVGHRVVHGGAHYTRPQAVTPELLAALEEMTPLAPDHLPHELKAIRAISRSFPDLRQAACFDTAFHRSMPKPARLYALPRRVVKDTIIRYGFHGLSYEYIVYELRKEAGEEADGRLIIAHLGNGASMAAVRDGKSLDTTMGFTPAGGLVMSTRAGDLDPGVLVYLMEEMGLRPSELNDLLNKQAGLLGVSGVSSDMKDLLEAEPENVHAAEAVGLFCYQARKFLGALTAVLGGLDTLIFTGGIGENAPAVRRRICKDMEFLGVHLDQRRNDANEPIVSRSDSPTRVRVMKTNEELMIARHTRDLIRTG
jgi:acetate kinase